MLPPFLPRNLASSSRTVRPGRGEQEVGRGQGAVARVVDHQPQRRQLDHVRAGPVDEGQLPVRVDRADALADVEGDRGEPLALDVDLLVQLRVAERPAAHGGQGVQQAPVGVVKGLVPAAARRHQPLLPVRHGHGRGQLVGPRVGGRQGGPRAPQQLPHRAQDRLQHRLMLQPLVRLQRDLV
jgi:hypothetical protein